MMPPLGARPELTFIPPAIDGRVLRLVQWVVPLWRRWHTSIGVVEGRNVAQLVHHYRQFQQGQERLMLAFRHPSPDDAYVLADLLWRQVPATARSLGITLDLPVHAHFIYDRGIPLWAGRWVGWLYSRLGGTPIQRGRVDRQGLRSARQLFATGRWPMAAAPEGGNNGHSERVSPLEPGVAQLGFWCLDDCRKEAPGTQVWIVPVGIAYRYVDPPWAAIDRLLLSLEEQLGIAHAGSATSSIANSGSADAGSMMEQRYQRLYGLGERLLALMEGYYQTVYPALATAPPPDTTLGTRLQALLDLALQVAETYFSLPAQGTVIDRCRRIEQVGWDRIFRLQDVHSPVERGLADRMAEEAQLRMWHMRLVEQFVAVSGTYVQQRPSAERFAETLLILRDTLTLIQGGNPFPRPHLGQQIAEVTVGEPLAVHDRWEAYRQSRKQAVSRLTTDLQTRLEQVLPTPSHPPA